MNSDSSFRHRPNDTSPSGSASSGSAPNPAVPAQSPVEASGERPNYAQAAENLEVAKIAFANGLDAFERGSYRQSIQLFEAALEQCARLSAFGGEVQTWLVNAYAAGDRLQDAIALCEKLSHHPDFEARQRGKQLLYILTAPKLKSRPEWLSQIPDLAALERDDKTTVVSARPRSKPRRPKKSEPEDLLPIDWSQINTRDNAFLWLALGAAAAVLGGLWWLS
ncbi:MAG: hypothetical protein AAF728_07220 [Cyanobacteria bacterium P01_D01_bin.128]